MSEQTPEQATPTQQTEQPAQPATTELNVEGDAVINQAPDGGGVDNNNAAE